MGVTAPLSFFDVNWGVRAASTWPARTVRSGSTFQGAEGSSLGCQRMPRSEILQNTG